MHFINKGLSFVKQFTDIEWLVGETVSAAKNMATIVHIQLLLSEGVTSGIFLCVGKMELDFGMKKLAIYWGAIYNYGKCFFV